MPAEHCIDPRPAIPFASLPQLLEYHAKRIPEALAILAPGRPPLSYGRLHRRIEETGRRLRVTGIGPSDRVAVVLPNGPEMAVATLAVASRAVCAPLNPAYATTELDKYFVDLRVIALVTEAGIDSPARRVAISRGIRVVELSTADDDQAGLLALAGVEESATSDDLVGPDDVALLMLTSGTTSRPKVVASTHANICTAAHSWGTALALTEDDRCLNVMPLFHGHGLIAVLLASLAAGASVICTPGYDAKRFFGWLQAFRPTWYSAVPTIHRSILAEARRHRESTTDYRLRFVRSGSAPLSPSVSAELERTFQAPVLEFCGITETAASPVACNPLPPRRRKPGSIGLPVDLDVAIMDDDGALLPRGQTGQVVVRGASVMSGYDGDPTATRAAFAGDWFKTGDCGFFDDDGYLFLVGRSKEIINRGGEKIAPREVEEVLLEHPEVVEAVAFAVPHPTLGEDVASAVVLRPDAAVTTKDIRQFVIGRIADFKVPREVIIVRELPSGPTGKPQRLGLAAKLYTGSAVPSPHTFIGPRTPLERVLAKHWAEILRVEQVGVHDNFFASGGDSLSVAQVLACFYEITHVEVEVSRFFEAPTVAEMARHLETLIQSDQAGRPSPVIARVPRETEMPASPAQERLWRLQQALPGIPLFNILYALRLMSAFDAALLEQSLNEIVRRHEILRTTFAVDDRGCVQIIAPQLAVRLTFDDLHGLSESETDGVGHEILQDEALHSFDLAHGPLLRVRLVRLTEREHLLLLTMHQIICDGRSLGVLANELTALYDALSGRRTEPLTTPSIQYADFAFWQRHWQSHPDVAAQLGYWREQLRAPLPVMKLAETSPKRQAIDVFRTARRDLELPASLLEAAKRFSRREGGTLFMALVAAFKTLLHRYLGEEDLRVATLVANRNRPGTEHLIGPLVNTVILRTNLSGDPSSQEVLRRVRATTLAAAAHEDLPFEELVATLERERALNPAALSQVMITLHNATLRPMGDSVHALTFEEANPHTPMPLVTPTTFDLILSLHEATDGRLAGFCVYKPNLFDVDAIDRLLRDFRSVLERMVSEPERPISAIQVSMNEHRPTPMKWAGRSS